MKNTRKLYHWLCFFVFIGVFTACESSQKNEKEEIDATSLRSLEKAATGGTLRAVLVMVDARPNDPIAQSIRVDLSNVTQWLDVLGKRNIIKIEKSVIQGNKATLKNIKQTLENLPSDNNDVIFFYFSGHGGMENGETFINTHDDQSLFRKDLSNLLQQKKGRLRIAITDACSNDIDGLVVSRTLGKTSKSANGDFDEAYKKLFYNYEGLLDIASSSKGEYAFSTDDLGGFFTHYFIKEGLLKNPQGGWEEIFAKAKDRTIQMFNRLPNQDKRELEEKGISSQTPVAYQLPKIIGTEIPDNTKPTPPPVVNGAIQIINNTNDMITFFIDNNLPNDEWDVNKLIKQQVAPKTTANIAQSTATITFKSDGQDKYYDLEKGKYYFELDEHSLVDLFSESDEQDRSYSIDYKQLLSNRTWAWEDDDGSEVTTSFNSRGTFKDAYNSGEMVEGTWTLSKENLRGTPTTLLHFTVKTEEDGKYVMTYAMNVEDAGYAIQLVFVRAVENEEVITYDDMLQDNPNFNAVMVLYRK